MKINKRLVQEVANGKYDSYDTHGEMKRAAQRILEEKVVSKFSAFCFRIFGGELPDNVWICSMRLWTSLSTGQR